MNGPLNDPMDGNGGVSEAVAALRQPSFLRVMLDTFAETRWLASLTGVGTQESGDVAPGGVEGEST